jgi:hypothetical protein
MRLIPVLTIVLLIYSDSFAQSEYYPGKIVIGTDTSAYLIGYNFLRRPSNVKLMEPSTGNIKHIDLGLVDAILLENDRYLVQKVRVPTGSDNFSRLDNSFVPQTKDSTLILRVIYEGSKSLYEGAVKNNPLFYFGREDNLQLLVFKRYKTQKSGAAGQIASNSTYVKQLLEYLDLSDKLKNDELTRLKYNRKSISSVYEKYYNQQQVYKEFSATNLNTKNSYLTSGFSRMSTFHDTSLENQFRILSFGYAFEVMARAPKNHSSYNEIAIGFGNLTVDRSSVSGFNRVYSVSRKEVSKLSISFSHLYKRYLFKGKTRFILGGGLSYIIEREEIELTRSVQDGPDDPFVPAGDPILLTQIEFPDFFLTPLIGIGVGRIFLEGRAHLGFLSGHSGLSLNLGCRLN